VSTQPTAGGCQDSAGRRERGQTRVILACRGPFPSSRIARMGLRLSGARFRPCPSGQLTRPGPLGMQPRPGRYEFEGRRPGKYVTWPPGHHVWRHARHETGRTRHCLDLSTRPPWPGPQRLIRPLGITCPARAYSHARLPGPLRPARDDGQHPWEKGAGNGDPDWPTLEVRLRRPAPKEPRAHQLSPSQVGFLRLPRRGAARVERQSSPGYEAEGGPSPWRGLAQS
jgi:hypothetical protein